MKNPVEKFLCALCLGIVYMGSAFAQISEIPGLLRGEGHDDWSEELVTCKVGGEQWKLWMYNVKSNSVYLFLDGYLKDGYLLPWAQAYYGYVDVDRETSIRILVPAFPLQRATITTGYEV